MTRPATPGLEGLLVIDKPGGPTSHDIVARVRSTLRTKHVGHAGTLDPLASGLLPLVLGRATRLVRFLPHSPKRYEGTLTLGIRTSSDDITGEILERCAAPLPTARAVQDAAAAFVGTYPQLPPRVSARKVGGRRMYVLARQGVEVDAPPTTVEVASFAVEPTDSPAVYAFVAEVSAGTYIRSLARDLGSALGCGGALASLRRTAIGPLSIGDAVAVPPVGPPDPVVLRAALIPLEDMPLSPPAVRLKCDEDATDFLQGRRVGQPGSPEGTCRVLSPAGLLIGIAEVHEGRLQPRVVLG